MSDYGDNGFARAQRAYDMQSDDSDEEEPEIDQEQIDNQYEDIDKIERLFIAAKLIYIDEMGGLQ